MAEAHETGESDPGPPGEVHKVDVQPSAGVKKRVVVGQTTVIDSMDDQSQESASIDGSMHGGNLTDRDQWIGDASGLINNIVSKALNTADGEEVAPQDIQKCLETLGFHIHHLEDAENEDADGLRLGCSTSKRPSIQSNSSAGVQRILNERNLMKSIFASRVNRYEVQQQHLALGRVMKNIFPADTSERIEVPTVSANSIGKNPLLRCLMQTRHIAHRIVGSSFVAGFFLLLTCFALFSPDMVALLAPKEQDPIFADINSALFSLFFFELILLCIAQTHYIFTMPFWLDVISLLSILGDTSFFTRGGLLNENQERLSRMARSSRMMRLARIMRVARVTKLVPRLMRFFRKQNLLLAKNIIQRRLWRVFLFLDTDNDGLISSFDLKVFYLATMQECPHMLAHSRLELLDADSTLLSDLSSNMEDEMSGSLDFEAFNKIMANSALGKDLIQFHLKDVEQEAGVWTLTQKLSDNTALKVCVGILILVLAMAVLETDVVDGSIPQGLTQLAIIATAEHMTAGRDAANTSTYICNHINIFVKRLVSGKDKVMFIFLDGRVYYQDGVGCFTDYTEINPVVRIEELKAESPVRESDIVQACWPDVTCVEAVWWNSTAIVDRSAQADDAAMWRLCTIVLVIALLLIFVYVLNMKINMFSGNLLQPLRSLVDDMMAMSCLELVHLEDDIPVEKPKSVQVAEELQHLETAFKGMRRAIRSWSMYVPPCVVERLYQTGIEATIGVARCNTTILFVDIDGFEDVCRDLSPKEVLDLLSHVLGSISDVIQKHQGTLLEFIGDEVLAVFNTPNNLKHHTYAGVLSCQEIHKVVESMPPVELNAGNQVSIQCRCGVHTAWILAGNIGSHKRMKYGLLGDGINLTARLKGLNSRYRTRTLASDSVMAVLNETHLHRRFDVRPLDLVAVKGKKQPITVYEVLTHPKEKKEEARDGVKKHAEAFKLYQERNFSEAKLMFEEVSRIMQGVMKAEEDEPSRLLISRCITYMREPPPQDWDGVERLNKKNFHVEAVAPAVDSSAKADAPVVITTPVLGVSDESRVVMDAFAERSDDHPAMHPNGSEDRTSCNPCCPMLTGVPQEPQDDSVISPRPPEGSVRPGSGSG